MNKINVLYENVHYENSATFNSNCEVGFFERDCVLGDLLKRANIKSSPSIKKIKKNRTDMFESHPRLLDNDSDVLESSLNKNHFQLHKTYFNNKCQFTKKDIEEYFKRPTQSRLTKQNEKYQSIKIGSSTSSYTSTSSSNQAITCREKAVTQFVSKERALDCKLDATLMKINTCLQEIRKLIDNGVAPLDDTEDMNRREKRANEFSSRFARNYLYQLDRQLVSLHTKHANVSKPLAYRQQLVNVGQIVLNGLQAYCHHVAATVVWSTVHHKFNLLVTHITDVCTMLKQQEHIHVTDSILNDIETNAIDLIQMVNTNLIMKAKTLYNKGTTQKVDINRKKQQMHQKQRRRHNDNLCSLENRFSMYTVVQKKQTLWKKSQLLANAARRRSKCSKILVPSVSLTANNKQPINKTGRKQPNAAPPPRTPSLSSMNHLNDDAGLATLVETVPVPVNSDVLLPQQTQHDVIRNELEPLLHSLMTSLTKRDEDETCVGLVSKLKAVLSYLQDASNAKASSSTNVKSDVITSFGPQNAKLIYISKAVDDECEPEPAPVREPEPERAEPFLSKSLTIRIIKYKLDFHQYTKSNLMYKKKTNGTVQPWHLISKLADNLFNNMLASLVTEIQLHNIVDAVYKSEFV